MIGLGAVPLIPSRLFGIAYGIWPSTLAICGAEIPLSQPSKILATLLLGAVSGLGFYQ